MYEILIVGGGPAGLTAAIYAARAGKHVAVLERGSTGGQIISAPLVKNYPGIPSVSGTELARQMTEQACTFGAEIVYTEAVGLEKTPAGFRVRCMDGVREAKAVILATGASHRRLGLPGEELLTGCGVSYCALCDGAFYEGADVAVVGGGEPLGTVTVTDPGVRLLLADGLTAADVSVTLELPERYILGAEPEAYAVYTIHGGGRQESACVRVKATITGLEDLLAQSANATLPTSGDLKPPLPVWKLAALSLSCTAAAAAVTYAIVRWMAKRKKKSKH